jgi:hypothetical protein
MAGWMDGRMDEWMDGWMDGWMAGWMDGWIDEWMDGWMEGCMDRWVDGSMDCPTILYQCNIYMHRCADELAGKVVVFTDSKIEQDFVSGVL